MLANRLKFADGCIDAEITVASFFWTSEIAPAFCRWFSIRIPGFALADSVRNEFVLWARGKVRPRPEDTVNPDMRTGEIEVLGLELTVLNAAKTPPFQLDEYSDAGEDIRLRYRYLDLRRPEMQQRLQTRAQITGASVFRSAGRLP